MSSSTSTSSTATQVLFDAPGPKGRARILLLSILSSLVILAVIALGSVALRGPLVGFLYGAAVGDPTGWRSDRALVTMMGRLTAVLAVPYVLRFVVQLPLFLAGNVVLLAVAKVALGWPLLIAALFLIGLLLSRGRTPIDEPASVSSREA